MVVLEQLTVLQVVQQDMQMVVVEQIKMKQFNQVQAD